MYCIYYTLWIDWLHPINNKLRNKRRNLLVGRCVSSWWPLFPSRNSVLIYIYVCILYTSSGYRTYTYTGSVAQYWWSCTPSQSIGLFFGGFYLLLFFSARFLCWMPRDFFGFINCVLLYVILGCLWPLGFVINYILILDILRSAVSHLPGCFCLLPHWKFFIIYRIQHGTIGPLYVTSIYPTTIFYRRVSSFATDCPCGVWCRGLITCFPHVGPLFGNRLLKQLGCRLDIMDCKS